ncbi:hypothetical protein Hanom_Chr13g01203611 [Helianthus anomalus]
MDRMGHNLLSAMIGLTFNQPYNFSLMILQDFQTHLGFHARDKRLMLLYPRFLMLIFHHLLPNLPSGVHFQTYAQDPMHKRIFKDCKTTNVAIHVNALPLVHPLLSAIAQEHNYDPETDQTLINIRTGVAQLFGSGDDDDGVPQ